MTPLYYRSWRRKRLLDSARVVRVRTWFLRSGYREIQPDSTFSPKVLPKLLSTTSHLAIFVAHYLDHLATYADIHFLRRHSDGFRRIAKIIDCLLEANVPKSRVGSSPQPAPTPRMVQHAPGAQRYSQPHTGKQQIRPRLC